MNAGKQRLQSTVCTFYWASIQICDQIHFIHGGELGAPWAWVLFCFSSASLRLWEIWRFLVSWRWEALLDQAGECVFDVASWFSNPNPPVSEAGLIFLTTTILSA